ncbi:radical SAM family heme chaperone HemW [Eubacterium ramulus]|uniref:radical SAM family heme chaperone HemW n=1 Tax=Eubacterium ramulus TaxID=39490 RepID=UPI001C016FE0|nr:radical SAM family heme chaperone HemW [Eubacterium ramulus]MBT9703711.1 oxygen-independent coproporphyrinogen III oxidase [Eubacterium ramulus]
MKELELYLHIPFCERKCAYCDFLSAPADLPVRISYIKKLQEEIVYCGAQYGEYQVSSIFFGGGTPTILEGYQLAAILETVKEHFNITTDAEITVECNPGTLTAGKAEKLVQAGFNRLSMGLQSADDRELHLLGRIHNFAQFLESYDLARKAGFRNINVDLMSALPGQTLKSWQDTLQKVTALRPEHISAYSLIIEEGTPFYERFAEDERIREEGGHPRLLPEEDVERQMYELTETFLHTKGYERYEISNYAKPGYECRHNCGYWTRKDYLGLGLGASSLVEHQRFQNTSERKTYLEQEYSPQCEGQHERIAETIQLQEETGLTQTGHHIHIETLDKKSEMEEFMFLGLRLMAGISRQQFEKKFQVTLNSVYGEVLRKLKGEQLIEEVAGYVRLTEHGIDVSNYVLAEFLL